MRRMNKTKRRIRFFLILAMFIALGAFIYTRIADDPQDSFAASIDKPTKAVEAGKNEPKETTITISAIGDVALGRDYRFKFAASNDDVFEKNNEDFNYFFSKVSHIFKTDDLTIANLESALTIEEKTAEKYDYGNNYWFKGDPKYANVLKVSGIEAVDLANNHTYDYLQKGYDDTKQALEETGIGYYGYEDIYETELKGIKIGMAGFNVLGNFEQGTDIEKLKAEVKEKIEQLKANNNFVIASFHWGKEYSYQYTKEQTELAHYAIDCGADFIIGHHPHVIQGVELYNNKYIIYSLGNYCFGGNKNPPDYDTFIYQQQIVFNKDKSIAEIKAPDYIPCYISSVKDINDYQPTLAKGTDIVRILNKINKFSPYKMSEETIKEKGKPDLVNLKDYVPDILIDLKYATTDNITGEVLYKNNDALLRRDTAEKLKKASEILLEKGYKIKVWDSYRPASVQQALWDKADNKLYFADPKKGSNHTRGCAVDITLTDLNGNNLDMPSDFDDTSGKATRKYASATAAQKQNALLLEKAMLQADFRSISIEWWHFDDTNYKLYDLIEEQ